MLAAEYTLLALAAKALRVAGRQPTHQVYAHFKPVQRSIVQRIAFVDVVQRVCAWWLRLSSVHESLTGISLV
jgi:hypothetical protein